MTEGTDNATVESRLTAVETKTDRLIKDVDESRAELKELRDIVETNDKTLRNDMQAMEARLIARQDETTAVLREEIGASADSLRTEIQETARSIRAEVQETASGLRKEMQASAKGLREEMQAHASGFDTKLLKNTELIADTKGQLRILLGMMVPVLIATCVHLVKLVAG